MRGLEDERARAQDSAVPRTSSQSPQRRGLFPGAAALMTTDWPKETGTLSHPCSPTSALWEPTQHIILISQIRARPGHSLSWDGAELDWESGQSLPLLCVVSIFTNPGGSRTLYAFVIVAMYCITLTRDILKALPGCSMCHNLPRKEYYSV